MDAGRRDAGRIMRGDAGTTLPIVDGVIGDTEWRAATSATSEEPTDHEGSVLTRLLAHVEDETLFVGIEGTIAPGDVMVVYVDHSRGDMGGVGELASLVDDDNPLDDAISSPLITPDSFAADFAWGTTTTPRTSVGLDAEMGWRDVRTTEFLFVPAETAPSVCSASACETSIPLETLGGTRPRTISMFVRIVNGDGGWVDQTLPMDDPDAPGIVSAVLEIDDGMVPDAGPPDAGPLDGSVDAGPPGIVVDGILSSGEWSAASRFSNPVTPLGVFVGNDASVLHVLRDATTLYVAIEGHVTTGNALVMYLDHDVGGPDGLASPTPLDDFVGGLDSALSKTLITPGELRLDMAWGTLDMDRVAMVGDDRMGWRAIGASPSAFGNVLGDTACGPNVCETRVALSALGVDAGAEIGLFVRLVAARSAAFSNQTLPRDDGFSPEVVSTFVSIPAP